MQTLEFLFKATRKQSDTIAIHQHRCYELVYYGCGQGTTRIGDREWRYESNQYALIRPATPHDERRSTVSEVICVGLSPDHLAAPLVEGVFADDSEAPVLPALASMLSEMQEQRPRYSEMLELQARQLVVRLERRHSAGKLPAAAADPLHHTLGFMREHFTQRVDFAALASMAGYSYDRYRHLFKQATGSSPGQYLLSLRLQYASSLLRNTNLTVAAIAMECGFSSDAQFCSLFKRELGSTPGRYRNPAADESLPTVQ